jgi:hypothetical protein
MELSEIFDPISIQKWASHWMLGHEFGTSLLGSVAPILLPETNLAG